MNASERQKAVNSLKEICQEIGCSGVSPGLCQERPHHCQIIRKLMRFVESQKPMPAEFSELVDKHFWDLF